jgi:chain length determinant protein EpsF
MSPKQLGLALLARRRLMLTTVASTLAAAAVVLAVMPPRYTATSSIVIDFKALDPVTGNLIPVAFLPGYLATQLGILSSQAVALRAVDSLKLADDPNYQKAFQEKTDGNGEIREWLAENLANGIKVDPSRESGMVTIAYRNSDPRRAAAIVNAIVRGYIDTVVDLKTEPARQTTAFFDSQLQLLRGNLRAAQKKLSSFQRNNGITVSDERYDFENAQLTELSRQLVAAQAQRYESASRLQHLDAAIAKGSSSDVLPEALNNPLIQSMKSSLVKAQSQLDDVSGRLGTNHPQYKAARAQVEDIRGKLAEEMNTVAHSVSTKSGIMAANEGALRSALAEQRGRVLEMKRKRDDAALLSREVENAQRAYDTAMTRFTQTRLESESNQSNITVIKPAAPPAQPSFPNFPLGLVFAGLVGSTLAVGLALVAEMMDRIVRCEDDVHEALAAPVLGHVLPASSDGKRSVQLLPRGRRRRLLTAN